LEIKKTNYVFSNTVHRSLLYIRANTKQLNTVLYAANYV